MIEKFEGAFRFLGNFWEVPIEFERETYPSVEHAFHAAKTSDRVWREKIRSAKNAAQAKRVGRQCPLREDWDDVKLGVMESLVRQKFAQHHMLADALKRTGTQELIEGNWWGDIYWGVCNGVGENHLGKILMKIREELKDGRSSD